MIKLLQTIERAAWYGIIPACILSSFASRWALDAFYNSSGEDTFSVIASKTVVSSMAMFIVSAITIVILSNIRWIYTQFSAIPRRSLTRGDFVYDIGIKWISVIIVAVLVMFSCASLEWLMDANYPAYWYLVGEELIEPRWQSRALQALQSVETTVTGFIDFAWIALVCYVPFFIIGIMLPDDVIVFQRTEG